jgi:hypothetical protein
VGGSTPTIHAARQRRFCTNQLPTPPLISFSSQPWVPDVVVVVVVVAVVVVQALESGESTGGWGDGDRQANDSARQQAKHTNCADTINTQQGWGHPRTKHTVSSLQPVNKTRQ